MRLRFLRISGFTPFKNIELDFNTDEQESPFNYKSFLCAVAGQNGVGKTRLLQALALALFQLRLYRLPKFSITMSYDLELNGNRQTVYFTSGGENEKPTEQNTKLVVFKQLTKLHIKCYDLKLSSNAPSIEKIYRGEALLQPEVLDTYLPKVFTYTSTLTKSWNKLAKYADSKKRDSFFLTQEDLKLAICALVLSGKNSTSFNSALKMLGLGRIVEINNKAGNSLLERIKTDRARNNQTPLELFDKFRNTSWRALNDYMEISFSKRSKPVSYDWLSEGEQALLGQTALFSLLDGTANALVLLDEPEKAFSENVKRVLASIFYNSLGETSCTVMFTTKSSIVLTDLFDWQIVQIRKIETEVFSRIVANNLLTKTFAASPSELMRDVFGCQDIVGQRACDYLDQLLSLCDDPNPKDIPSIISEFEKIEERLGAGYYQLEFRRRLRALRKLAA